MSERDIASQLAQAGILWRIGMTELASAPGSRLTVRRVRVELTFADEPGFENAYFSEDALAEPLESLLRQALIRVRPRHELVARWRGHDNARQASPPDDASKMTRA